VHFLAALALLPVLTPARAAFAQSESGRAAITGSVADAEGGAVPNATITVKDTQTGQTRTVTSDGAGLYSVPTLTVGSYTVSAIATGFGETSTAVDLAVGQTAEIKIVLKPGSVSTAVNVTDEGEGDLTHKTETANATVLSNDLVESLPTRGRNFTDFALLTPGISQEIDRFGLVVNGQRSGGSNISIDGVDFNDPLQNGQRGGSVAVYFFPQVAVREFQVVRTGASAEIGRTNAGFVNVVTKSGTNRFHGEALYTNRNPWLTWPDALNDPEATNNQNQFAFGIGGPIIKDKLFFFAGVEKTVFEVPFFVRIGSNCPTAGYYDTNNFVEDIACSQANNPGTPSSPTLALPAQYAALETNSYGLNSPLASSARLDWQASPRNTAMLQYMSTFLSNVAYGISGVSNASVSNNTTYSQQSQAVVLGLTSVLASNRTNDAHVQWVYDNRLQVPNSPGPEIDISDFLNIGGNTAGTFVYRAIREEAIDNYSLLLGRHSLRFGVDINLEPETQQREVNPNGLWTIDTFEDYLKLVPTAQGGGGMTPQSLNTAGCGGGETRNANGTYTAGSTCAVQFQQTLPYNNGPLPRYIATQREFAGYVQDTFHALNNLTLNLGLRYEAQLEPAAPANPAVPGTGVDPSDVSMVQPRFGLAWDAYGDGKTVLRASTGLFDSRTPGYILQHIFTDNGAQVASINTNYDQALFSSIPNFGSFQSFSAVPSGANILNDAYTNNPAFRNPRSLQVALAIEQQLSRRAELIISGTQQETWKLQHRLDTNLFQPTVDPTTLYPLFPSVNPMTGVDCQFGGVQVPCRPNNTIAGFHQNYSTGHSTYRGLTAQLRGSITKRVLGIANFTWASNRDDDSNERDADRELALDSLCTACYNRGYSQQDIREQFNITGVYHMPYRFTFSTSFIARTALPYTAVTSGSKQGDINNDGNDKNDRAVLCSQKAFTTCPVSLTQFNSYKGTGAETGVVVGRNTFRQDGFLNWDMRLIKAFRMKKGEEVQVSAECLNCSRASNLNLGSNATSKFTHAEIFPLTGYNPLTGYYYSGGSAGLMTTAYDTFRSGGPRQIQLGARYIF
jgi:hypothetical protein